MKLICFAACLLICTSSVLGQADELIYSDSLLNGWQDYGWAVRNYANASPVHSGSSSISVTADSYQALYLHHSAFDTSTYSNLTFWINGGAAGGQKFQVHALTNGQAISGVSLPPMPANSWQQISLSLATLGVANRPNMDGFWIQSVSNTPQATFYVDDIRLTAKPPPALVNVSVNTSQVLQTVDARMFALNAAIWDSNFDTANTTTLLREIDCQALRFPGGSSSDDYHWGSNTSGTNTWTWATSFDKFAHVATNIRAQVFITANYGNGAPQEASNWVRYANVTKRYGFTYWEIGNENYGTGKKTRTTWLTILSPMR